MAWVSRISASVGTSSAAAGQARAINAAAIVKNPRRMVLSFLARTIEAGPVGGNAAEERIAATVHRLYP
jgi:hypothetical protein